MNEHGYCPKCNANMDGGDILEHFRSQDGNEERAKETASHYGYEPGRTQWCRAIGIYDLDKDRTVQWQCPECDHVW